MSILDSLVHGFTVAISPSNMLYVLLGVLIGMVIGVLPGLGPSASIALLLPLTYALPATSAIIMLAGIYYGAYYGGTITSVLLRIPGEAATVVTTYDGYQMARQGRAGPALGIAAIGSFIGGTVAVIGMTAAAPTLARLAVEFGPPEYVALALLGVLLIIYLGSGSTAKGIVVASFGLLLATVGQDPITATPRFTFGVINLFDGINFVAIAMGLFGVGEILYSIDSPEQRGMVATRISRAWPSRADALRSRGPILRGSLLGFFIGVLPGGGGVVSSLASYAVEKRRAADPNRFGRGAIEGVAGPETANNASSTAAFIPLLTLGIPPNVVLALLYGALLLQGITPGPQLISQHPDVFWGVIASMYVGNGILLVLSIPLVSVFIQMLRVRVGILATITVTVTMVGVYTVNNNIFHLWVVVISGLVGYLMRKGGFDPGPLVLAFVLGPLLESSVRRSLLISGGDMSIFFTRPLAGALFAVIFVVVLVAVYRQIRGKSGGNSNDTMGDDVDASSPH